MYNQISQVLQSVDTRLSENLFRYGRDTEIIANTNYGIVDPIISYSDFTVPPNNFSYIFSGATLLFDGRVLCTNGQLSQNSLVYDPITDTAVSVINDSADKNYSYFGGVLLKDGRVFIPPYYTFDNSPAQARIYDPATNKITLLPRLYENGRYGSCVLLDGYRLYINPYYGTKSLVLDLETDNVYEPPMVFSSNGSNSCALLVDGRVCTGKFGDNKLYFWNPVNNDFSTIVLPSSFIYQSSYCVISDGRIFMTDFSNSSGQINLIYDVLSNTSSTTPKLPTGELATFCSTMPDGSVLVVTDSSENFQSIYIYDPIMNNYTKCLDISPEKYYYSQILLFDGRIMLIPNYSYDNTSTKFIFVGEKLPKHLPTARVCSPIYNRV